MWDHCGMIRNEKGLTLALKLVNELKEEFWRDVIVPGTAAEVNQELEKAGRVADYLELAALLITDALNRKESCGAHFREEYQTEDGEALRNDDDFTYVAAWEYAGAGKKPILHKEQLKFENVHLAQSSYK